MGKKKGKKSQPLTQEEVWDDSALVRSWNEAVEEYNLYHSIHARGENVDEVLRRAESEEANDTPIVVTEQEQLHGANPTGSQIKPGEPEEGEISDVEVHDSEMTLQPPDNTETVAHMQNMSQPPSSMPNGSAAARQVPDPGPPMVPHELLSGQNDGLKQLMMAWYWAGYYTRQAEEQQQQQLRS